MKEKKPKRHIRYLLFVLLLIVILTVAIAFGISRKTADHYQFNEMSRASLPLVTVRYADTYATELHGYVNKMSAVDMREVIVPLKSDKTLHLSIDRYQNAIDAVSYQIRSLDDTEYVDGGDVTSYEEDGNRIEASIHLSDLLKYGREYQFILPVVSGGRPIHYYTRILCANTTYAKELLDFASEFSDATYDSRRSSFIVNYIQPEDSAKTDDISYTDIHSKYASFTYAGIGVERQNDRKVRITEFEPTQLSVLFTYTILMMKDGRSTPCSVQEFFSVRYRSGKIYLLDYYRRIEERFMPERSTGEKGRIVLGVGSGDTSVLTSRDSTYTVFSVNRELWCYNAKTNSMNLIFSFKDDQETSGRSDYDHHAITPVKVSDDGSVDYMVYGYMNRGLYEGQVGICFYRYDAKRNGATRLFYMPVYQSELMLMMDLGTLVYVNDEDVCYLRYGDGIYSIDLNSGESVEVSLRAYPGMYAKNAEGNVVAWTEGADLSYPERLVILNMDSQTTLVVDAEAGQYVKIMDFIGDDIIYGFGSRDDSVIFANIDIRQILNRIVIASTDEKLTIREEYQAKNCFILSVGVYENRLTINRGVRTEEGEIREIDDEILLITENVTPDRERSKVLSRQNETVRREYYIQVGKTTNVDSQFSALIPRFESQKNVNVIELYHHQENVYYVYGYGRLLSVKSELNRAIREAYTVFGVVVDENMNYLWTRGTRDLFKTISIQAVESGGSESSLAASIRILTAEVGLQTRNAEALLSSGKSPLSIIDSEIGEGRAVNLYGCTLQEVLYFVNEGHPVMAITGDREAVVLIGYDLDNVMIYDPATGETKPMEMNAAAGYFEGLNRLFVTYK